MIILSKKKEKSFYVMDFLKVLIFETGITCQETSVMHPTLLMYAMMY